MYKKKYTIYIYKLIARYQKNMSLTVFFFRFSTRHEIHRFFRGYLAESRNRLLVATTHKDGEYWGYATLAAEFCGTERSPPPNPKESMYCVFTYIWLIFMVNVGIYTIHGSYGSFYTLGGSLTAHPWKMMIGRLPSLFEMFFFSGAMLNL